MFSNHFRFLVRRLWRQKLHTTSHLIGLTIGISVCLIIGLFVHYELNFDTHHQKTDRIYRVNQVREDANGERSLNYGAPGALAEALRSEVAGLEQVTSVYPRNERMIETENKERFMQKGILYAEANFLDVFNVNVLRGNAKAALEQPWQALLTASTAEKIFGKANPIGKTLTLDGENTLTIAGVIEDFPSNTHLPANILVSYFQNEEYLGFDPNSWMFTFGASTYALLEEGINPAALEAPIAAIYDKNFNDKYGKVFGDKADAVLQPLAQIHFETEYDGGGAWVKAINPRWLWFFGSIGIIVLVLACINFINLSTAQSLSRSREVGVRKAIGATRTQLITQFLNESFLLMSAATIFTLAITYFSLPVINTILDKGIDFKVIFQPISLLVLLAFFVTVSLLTGIYPAWLIAKFQPATSLKSSKNVGSGKSPLLRKILITTQFAVSGALLIALIFISQQMKFFYQKSLGFDKENVITFDVPDQEKIDVLSNELQQLKGVKNYSFNSSTPSELTRNGTIMHLTDLSSEDSEDVELIFGDEDYASLFNLSLLAGKMYKDSDTSLISASLKDEPLFPKVLVNEQLLKTMNFGTPEEAIGQRFKIGYNDWQPEIVGVVKDFVTSSLHNNIDPVVIMQAPEFISQASLKLNPSSDLSYTLAEVQDAWERTFPEQVYDHKFFDEHIESFYESENLLFSFFKIFAGLAMLISCIGLWGLATHTAAQRTKEIGVRKVLGASVTSLVGLLAKDFVKLVIIGLLIAIPVTWYLTSQWLQNFAFAIELQWWVCALAAFSAIGIALLTVSFQSVKAALINPIESLRNE